MTQGLDFGTDEMSTKQFWRSSRASVLEHQRACHTTVDDINHAWPSLYDTSIIPRVLVDFGI